MVDNALMIYPTCDLYVLKFYYFPLPAELDILLILLCGRHTLAQEVPWACIPSSALDYFICFKCLLKSHILNKTYPSTLFDTASYSHSPTPSSSFCIIFFPFLNLPYYLLAYRIKYEFVKFITYYLVSLLEYNKLYKDR